MSDLGELLACRRRALLDRLPGRPPLAHRDLALAIGVGELVELRLSCRNFLEPLLSLGGSLLAALHGSLQVARIDAVQYRLGDEPLHLVGVDVRLAAAGEADSLGAGIAALA